MGKIKTSFMDIKSTKSIIFATLEILFFLVGLCGFIICATTGNSDIYVREMLPDNIWFNLFQYFTWQSNFVMLVLCILYFFNIKYHFIKKPTYLIAGMTYITVTFIVFNTLLMPSPTDAQYLDRPLWWLLNAPIHMVCPIMSLLFFIFVIKDEYKTKHFNFTFKKINLLMFMIYPVIYCIYMIAINFIHIRTSGGWDCPSVYGPFTNINPNNHSNITGKNGSPIYILSIMGIALVLLVTYLVYNSCIYKKMPWKLFCNK